jgi:hypothetical protein
VVIALASAPDVRIQEEFGGRLQNKVAIEIKGGTDRSNAHNRAGEAEKSHQKARAEGFRDFWTIIAKAGLNLQKLRARARINWHFGASAGWAAARRRDAGDVGVHRRGAATKQMPTRRRALSGCGPQARWLCCSLLTYHLRYTSSLASRQRAWGPAAKCQVILARALSSESPTTNSWFDAPHVLGRKGEDWEEFRARVASQVGIPIT